MILRTLLVASTAVFALASCTGNAPSSRSSSFVPAANLATYQTYAWSSTRSLSLRDPNRNTATAKGWIEQTVEAELAAKGLTKTDASNADLLVGYTAGSRSLSSSQSFTDYGELGQNRRQEESGTGQLLVRSGDLDVDYEQGRLLLDLTDRKTGKMVYRGVGEAALFDQPSASKSVPRLNKTVKGMLKEFPGR